MARFSVSYLLTLITCTLLVLGAFGRTSSNEENDHQLCQQLLGTVQNALNQRLSGHSLPALSFECVRGGKDVSVSALSEELTNVDIDRVNDANYMDSSASEVFNTLRGSYRDLSGNGKLNNARHTETPFIESANAGKLVHKWRFNAGLVVPGSDGNDTVAARIVGPLGVLQATNDTLYVVLSLFGWDTYIAPGFLRDSYIVAIDRSNGAIRWVKTYSELSTQAIRLIAQKYPHMYNVSKVMSFTRNVAKYPGAFGPLLLTDDGLIIVSEAVVAHALLTPAYFAGNVSAEDPHLVGFPQANGGPVIKEHWSVTNNIRHYIPSAVMALDAESGTLLGADNFLDVGEGHRLDARGPRDRSAQGFVATFGGGRMAKYFTYKGVKKVALGVTMLDFPATERFMITNYDRRHVRIGRLNGNIQRHYGRFTQFTVTRNSSGVFFDEDWRRYTNPRWVFAGDANPYNASEIFTHDTRASEYNYGVDGSAWAPGGIIADTRRGIIYYVNANGKYRPVEEIKAAINAIGTFNEKTGGQGYPNRTYLAWRKLMANAKTPQELQQIHADYVQTAEDQLRAIHALYPRAKEYLSNAIHAVNMTSGETIFVHRSVMGEGWQSYNFQWDMLPVPPAPAVDSPSVADGPAPDPAPAPVDPDAYLPPADDEEMPMFHRWQLLAERSDNDYGAGIAYNEELDVLVGVPKDGRVEVIDMDTGVLISSTRTGFPTAGGTNNYGFEMMGTEVFVVSMNADSLGYAWGPLHHETTIGPDGLPSIRITGEEEIANMSYPCFPTDKAVGDNGPRKRCIDGNSLILVGVDLLTGKIIRARNISDPANVRADLVAPFSTPIGSVNNLLMVSTTFDSSLVFIDSKTFDIRFTFNGHNDLVATGGKVDGRNFTIANTLPIVAGYQVFWCLGESGFQGAAQGRDCHAFEPSFP